MIGLLWLIPALPFAGALLLILFGSRLSRRTAAAVGMGEVEEASTEAVAVSMGVVLEEVAFVVVVSMAVVASEERGSASD